MDCARTARPGWPVPAPTWLWAFSWASRCLRDQRGAGRAGAAGALRVLLGAAGHDMRGGGPAPGPVSAGVPAGADQPGDDDLGVPAAARGQRWAARHGGDGAGARNRGRRLVSMTLT